MINTHGRMSLTRRMRTVIGSRTPTAMAAKAKPGEGCENIVHHVNVIQSSEAGFLDAVAAALPRPGRKMLSRRGACWPNDRCGRWIRPQHLTRINVVDGKQVIEALDPRHLAIAFARGGPSGDRTRSNSALDGMSLSEIAW
jgi:hypothetical protein